MLFLDEAPEFAGGCLDALRQPLESGEVVLSRSGGTVRYPARFTLVMAANPCPCGQSEETCRCTPQVRRRCGHRLSGPLLDRVDLVLEPALPSRAELLAERAFLESSATVAARVQAVRELGRVVFAGRPWALPSEIPGSELRGNFAPAAGATAVLEPELRRGRLSARGLDRALRVAWTLALCAGRRRPEAVDVHTAVGLRLGSAPVSRCPGPERLARAALSRVGPDDRGLRALIAAEGVAGAWASLRRGDGRAPGGRLTGLLARAAQTDPERDLATISLGGRLICPGDPEWPTGLDALDHLNQPAPYALWLRGSGHLATLAARGVAVVGARAATAYGVRVPGDLGAELAGAGCCVVSSGGYGICGATHRGVLVMDGATVVVLACGADVAYPRGHASLFARAATAGVIVSEASRARPPRDTDF